MIPLEETAALVALLRDGRRRPARAYAGLVEERGSAISLLEEDHGFFALDGLTEVHEQIAAWRRRGIRILTVLDADYPENLRAVYDRPPLVFVAGALAPCDARSIAVVGARDASPRGLARTRSIAEHLVEAGYTVASGLAAGIDTVAHRTALDRDGRTVAVVGTGLGRCYPPANAALQRSIETRGAVVSQFWPDTAPSRAGFLMRNALMSGLTLGTVVAEASQTSGSRAQARMALEHGRPVFLPEALLEQAWARDYADRPGVHLFGSPGEITEVVDRITATGALVE